MTYRSLRSDRSRSLRLLVWPALAVAALLVLAACAGGTGRSGWTFAPPQPTSSAAAGSPGASGGPAGSPAASGSLAPGSPAASGSTAPGSPAASQPGESTAPGSPAASTAASPAASGASGSTIELEETADVHIVQAGQPVSQLTVKQGDTVIFKVTNSAGFEHNFYIGPAAQLEANDPTGLPGIPTFTSGTQELTYTVTADTANLEFACTLPGHYPTMHGTFSVQP